MTPLSPRNILPALTLIAASLFLVDAVPHALATPASSNADGSLQLALAEIRLCETHGGRSRDECIDEARGKALIRRAERDSARSE